MSVSLTKYHFTGFFVVTVPFTIGCMPADFNGAVDWQIQRDRATDAKSQAVEGMPFLRVDDYLLDRLAKVETLPADQVRTRMSECADECHLLALKTAVLEVERLSDRAIDDLWQKFFRDQTGPIDRRAKIRQRYLDSLSEGFKSFSGELATGSTDQLRDRARHVLAAARSSVKDRHGFETMMRMIRASHPTTPVPTKFDAPRVCVYSLGRLVKEPLQSDFDDARRLELLQRFAPRIVQQVPEMTAYASTCDMIGSVELRGSRAHVDVTIQTAQPSVYAYFRNAIVRDLERPQLVYCYWYPEHPPTQPGDPEAGPVDGATIRITLDSRMHPAIIEAVQNCGCHYRCFAARDLDCAAAKEFGVPPDKSLSALTRPDSAGIEIIVEDLFDRSNDEHRPPIILSPAAAHVPVGVTFDDSILKDRTILATNPYLLQPYELLENMPTPFGRASMFGSDGLVHNAGRAEGWLMAGTGMLSAGQPRQRGTQLICWDKHSFDDPHLLESSLRIPKDF